MKADPEARLACSKISSDSVRTIAPLARVAARSFSGLCCAAFLDAVYAHLLSFDDTRRYFIGSTGDVDPVYIAIHKEHLTSWLLAVTVNGIAKRHVGRG